MHAGLDAKQAAAYRLGSVRATPHAPAPAGEHVLRVLGPRFATSTAGRILLTRRRDWLRVCDAALGRLLEFAPIERLAQVYRAPLRVERQVVATTYELHTAACLADVVRGLEFNVGTQGRRRADLRARFLSRTFHVEVKTHENRRGSSRRGGLRVARALELAARAQASGRTPNLLVLGHVSEGVVVRVANELAAGSCFGALVWLELQPRRSLHRSRVLEVAAAARPFPPSFLEILAHALEVR